MALERKAERAVVRNAAFHGVGLLRADDGVLLFDVLVNIEHAHAAADGHDVRRDFDLFHDLSVLDQVRDLGNAGVELALLRLGLVVLAVFRQVAERARLLDELRDFLLAGRFKIVQFFLERVQTLLTHLISAVDRHNPSPYIIEIFVYTI